MVVFEVTLGVGAAATASVRHFASKLNKLRMVTLY